MSKRSMYMLMKCGYFNTFQCYCVRRVYRPCLAHVCTHPLWKGVSTLTWRKKYYHELGICDMSDLILDITPARAILFSLPSYKVRLLRHSKIHSKHREWKMICLLHVDWTLYNSEYHAVCQVLPLHDKWRVVVFISRHPSVGSFCISCLTSLTK